MVFGFLTEVLFFLSTFLDTEPRVLVTLLLVFLFVLTVLDRVVFDGVLTLALERVLVVLLFVLVLLLGLVTLVSERVVVPLSDRFIDLVVLALSPRVVLVVLPRVALDVLVDEFSARRVVLVLVISVFLRVADLCIVRSLLFLGVCTYLSLVFLLFTCALPRLPLLTL